MKDKESTLPWRIAGVRDLLRLHWPQWLYCIKGGEIKISKQWQQRKIWVVDGQAKLHYDLGDIKNNVYLWGSMVLIKNHEERVQFEQSLTWQALSKPFEMEVYAVDRVWEMIEGSGWLQL